MFRTACLCPNSCATTDESQMRMKDKDTPQLSQPHGRCKCCRLCLDKVPVVGFSTWYQTHSCHDICVGVVVGGCVFCGEGIITISAGLVSLVAVVLSWTCLPGQVDMNETVTGGRWWHCALVILLGLWFGSLFGFVTENYTSRSCVSLQGIAETQTHSATTGVVHVIR